MNSSSVLPAVTRRLHRPLPDTLRLWTMQPLAVWQALQAQQTLLVDPRHPEFTVNSREAYDWMRGQMARRIPNYAGHYPWWGYDEFLDLRLYRWHTPPYSQRLVRLELAIPIEQTLLSSYGRWHWSLNRWYLPSAYGDDNAWDREMEEWEAEAKRNGVNLRQSEPLAEPWETRLRASWERIFDIEPWRPTEMIQAVFERLELAQVVRVTEFTSMPERDRLQAAQRRV